MSFGWILTLVAVVVGNYYIVYCPCYELVELSIYVIIYCSCLCCNGCIRF